MRVRWNSIAGNLLMQEVELMRKLEMSQIKRQIEILATFMPDEILNMPFSELNEVQNFVGVLLFADVSGFTPLCEKYNKTGKGGIYRLTATLNAYIGAIVEVIYFYGGDVLKFSGDAFLAMWKADPSVCMYKVIHEVIVCALFIQATLGRFETEVNVLLKVKLAISCGNMSFSIIGDDIKHYVIMGQAINDVKAAEHASVSGDVIIAPKAWNHIAAESYDYLPAADGNIKILRCLYKPKDKASKDEYDQKHVTVQKLCEQHIKHRALLHAKKKFDNTKTDSKLTEEFIRDLPPRTAVKAAPQKWVSNDIRPFIIKPVQEQVDENQPLEYLTEMREVTIQFINIVPSTFDESELVIMVDSAYQIICNIICRLLGVVNKVSLFDKDAMILVLFGLRGIKHELESQNSLKSAYKIMQAVSKLEGVKSVSVGVTNGLVYCGVVGHPLRREYTVIGGSVNKAARIMCAYPYKVTCDYTTYKNSKLSSCYFQLQSAIKLKGIEDAGHIFEYNESFEETIEFDKQNPPTLGREDELDLVHMVVCHPEKTDTYRSVCFYGKMKMGKSKLLNGALENCIEEGQTCASVYLCGTTQRPYYCLSMLYKQLYDAKTKINSKESGIIKELPREIWNLNDIVNCSAAERKSKISKMFETIVRDGKNNLSVVFVDNVQYIDMQSLDVLLLLLNTDCLRAFFGGQFHEESWDVKWKMSLNDQVKLWELGPLSRKCMAPLVCQILNTRGVHKKMLNLIIKSCEGRPGWVQTSVLRQVNNGSIEIAYVKRDNDIFNSHYIFPDLDDIDKRYENDEDPHKRKVVPVVQLSKNSVLKDNDLTLAAISMDLFDSFNPYQQLLIKTAAVLGEIFTRSLMIVILKYPNEQTFCSALQHLFEEDAFDCGTRYINSGGLPDNKVACYCYMDEEEIRLWRKHVNLPKYTMCKLLHFKNKSLRSVAYELLPANQRKELHLRVTELVERQNNSCPSCLRNNSAAIIKMRTFKDIMQYCNDPYKVYKAEEKSDSEEECDPEMIKSVIRATVHKHSGDQEQPLVENTEENVVIPKRKVWDPSVCFCLEILTKVYADLIYHSDQACHLGKRIFYLMEYGAILIIMNECESAIPYLSEASELCMIDAKLPNSAITDAFRKIHVGKIHMLLGEAQFRLGNIPEAKNHLVISLRQYNVPMIAMRYSLPNRILNRFCLTRARNPTTRQLTPKNSLLRSDFGICMNLTSNILAAEGHWGLAKMAAARSLSLLRDTNSNISIFCDVYSSAIELYNTCGDTHICEKLERCIRREILRKYTGNIISELYALCKLISIIFQTRVLAGNISAAIRIGYRSMDLNITSHSSHLQIIMLPVLVSVLLMAQRIPDAVGVMRILRNLGKIEDEQALVAYYALCMELNVETSFLLETVERCEHFAKSYFHNLAYKNVYSPIECKLIIYLHCHYMRNGRWNEAFKWKNYYNQETSARITYTAISNHFIFTESTFLMLVRDLQLKKQFIDLEEKKVESFLKECEVAAKRWKIFEARALHFRAYYSMLRRKPFQAKQFLKEALEIARTNKNLLETSWIRLSQSCWSGGFSFGNKMKDIDWRLAKTYNELQWSQIMYALPHEID